MTDPAADGSKPSETARATSSDAQALLARIAPPVDWCALRLVEHRSEGIAVRRGVSLPPSLSYDRGAMITVIDEGGIGYAATSDLSFAGLYQAAREAHRWAERSHGRTVCDFSALERPRASGEYESRVRMPWDSMGLGEKIDRLRAVEARLGTDPRIVDRRAVLEHRRTETRFVTTDGVEISQRIERVLPDLVAIASANGETQQRSLGGRGSCRQGGLEVLDDIGYDDAPEQLREEAIALLSAPECPTGTLDLLLGPAQMILQIHESIGHPLELDRILGDERNYAGTSFVRAEDFGTLRYGSELLNVTFDPTVANQLASYGFDDEGMPAKRTHMIRRGVLERGLGGWVSQQRLGVEGVACMRACAWNRPAIDRMANLNVEPGEDSIETIVRRVRNGVWMDTNSSWSIDDSRRNFQFGCEIAWLIEDGERTTMVRNPGYRGQTLDFWRSLTAVGNQETMNVLGTPNCGKGEPNQMIEVGHSSPACLFAGVEVFGSGR